MPPPAAAARQERPETGDAGRRSRYVKPGDLPPEQADWARDINQRPVVLDLERGAGCGGGR